MNEPGPGGPTSPSASSREVRLVRNPLTGEYLVQSPARMHRREGTTDCPFCEDLAAARVPAGTAAWARPNDFPALRPPVGESLILIYRPEHDRTFADLAPEEALGVVTLWQDVYADLTRRYPCVMTWETSGAAIGQTQYHPHGQTFAIAVLPPILERELATVVAAEAAGQGCPFCAILAGEQDGPRRVAHTEHWVAFIPPYARYPYEVHVYPRRHMSDVAGFEREGPAARELAALLPRLVRAENAVFQAPMPYMLAIHQLADPRFHLHIELLATGRAPGKLKLPASSEMAWGLWINDSLPEQKAAELRAAYMGEAQSPAG